MTDETQSPAQALVRALARVHGSLQEIGTVWRRLAPERPGLPLTLPSQLAASVHDVMAAVATDPSGTPARLAALERDLAAAAALTNVPGAPAAGDAGLWEYTRAALNQARDLAATRARLPLAS